MQTYKDKTPGKGRSATSIDMSKPSVQNRTSLQHKDNRPRSVAQRKQAEASKSKSPGEPVVQRKENKTGLPDQLKSGIENLSGQSMDDVKVHYNSSMPKQLHAHAYAQGSDIHLAPGQEKHLPHEAWHVVQQKQGRVKPTKQFRGKVQINDELGLEKEADAMGNKALQMQAPKTKTRSTLDKGSFTGLVSRSETIQGKFYEWNPDGKTPEDQHIWHWGPIIPALWAPKMVEGEQVKYKEYGVWLRKGTQAHFQQLIPGSQHIARITEEIVPQLEVLRSHVGSRDQIVERINHTHELTKRYVTELGIALKKYATATIIGVPITVGVAALAQHFLSLPAVPIAVKAAIDIAGILYGAYVTYRWMKTDLLPVLARAALAGGNTIIWATTIYAILSEGLNGNWFNTVHIAALPLAITIEFVLRKLMSRVETMMVQQHRPDEHAPLVSEV